MRVLLQRLIRNKLLTQSGFYLAGQLIQKATSFLLVPVWTFYLLPSDYGIVGTMGAYSTLLHIVLMLGIYSAVVRYLFDKHPPEEQKAYVFSNFIFLCLVSGCVLFVLCLFGEPWWVAASSGSIPFRPIVTVTLASVWAGLISRFLLFIYQTQQRPVAYVTMEGIGFVLSVCFGLTFVAHYKMGAYGQILGAFIAQIVVTAISTVIMFRDWFSRHLRLAPVWDALKFGLPVVPHLLSGWALTFVDRIMLEHYVDLRDVGFYNLGYNLGIGMLVLVTSINQAYQPYYYDAMASPAESESKILKVTSVFLAAVGLITLAGCLFAGELISLLTPAKYQQAAVFVPPILFSYLLVGLYYFVGSPVMYLKKTKLLPLITGTAAVLNIVLNYLLIPRYGAIAAAWTTLIAYGVMLVFYYVVSQKLSPLNYPLTRYIIILGILLAVVIFVSPSPQISPGAIVLKLIGCALFAGVSFGLLARPYFAPRLIS